MLGTIEIRWRRLRFSLAAFAAATLAGVAATAAAWWHEHRIVQGMEAAETRLAEARERYSALAGERENWRRFGPLYRRMAAQGRLGEERPARWTEAVRSAVDGLPAARYRLGATRVVENEDPIEVRATDLSIDLELRHEAELPRFLAVLEQEAPGMFTVSGCRLERTSESDTGEPPSAHVDAACRIRWQSVVLSGVEPGWTPAAGLDGGSHAGPAMAGSETVLVEPPGETLGRLFTTAAERARIDSARAAPNAAGEAGESPDESPARSRPPPREPRWLHVGGVVLRSGHWVVAWIDGKRITHGGRHLDRPAPAEPRGLSAVRLDAGGRSILVRPGQRFNPRTGVVNDPIRSPEDQLPRGRSRRESSPAPLTHPPAPDQN